MRRKVVICSILACSYANADHFFNDSKNSLWTRNYYYDRNYTEISNTPALKEWAQGFIYSFESGYTDTPVALGLDIQAAAGFKLHADREQTGAGLLPIDKTTREAADSYGEIGWTIKAKYQQTEMKAGTLMPFTPVIFSSRARLLPQTFRGVEFKSKDLEKTNLTLGYVDKVNQRDSTNFENIRISTVNGKFKAAETDSVYYGGFQYLFDKHNSAGFYSIKLDDIYQQHVFLSNSVIALNESLSLIPDLKFYINRADGKKLAGEVDNELIAANFSFKHDVHTFSVGFLKSYGDTAFPYIAGGEVLFFLDGLSTDFLNPREDVYSIRYDYDFKNYIPGLKGMVRYSQGDHIYLPTLGGTNLKEKETAFDIQYNVPEGRLKGLAIRARYAFYDNDFSSAAAFKPDKELRLGIDYTWNF
ncbi:MULTISPECIES: OprD family outer membrane porin [unclassified Acinetobacter]|uniref:OprD family outer membrane porin n=1 Tax=unclassified Acinetobacter TaxID=196816 RepID=UPI00190B7222|nr:MULTISPECIES: OprD family outer membrane porin [unclassified Acinetobacter]MBK0062825.1 outer membrane porin, OprD family [Acinetobacter sp. S55]MBK0065598.1 outer membrane porin, OprD family [Acinetobacter sp. S54]